MPFEIFALTLYTFTAISSPEAVILLVCARNQDLSLQHRKSMIHGLIVKSDKSDWLKSTERVLCACSEIGSGQRSRFLAQTRRIAASGDENAFTVKSAFLFNILAVKWASEPWTLRWAAGPWALKCALGRGPLSHGPAYSKTPLTAAKHLMS